MKAEALQEKIQISFGIALYTAFTVCIAGVDYLQYLLSLNYWWAFAISAAFVVLCCFLLRKRVALKPVVITKGDVFMLVAISVLSIIRIAIPATDFDTYNYHLYFQQCFGRDFINSDFFPIRACNAHYFILGDRMIWLFRQILGYRLGVFFNTIVLFLIYFQLKDIVNGIDRDRERKLGKWIVPIVAITMFTETLLQVMDSYLIDTFALPFLLEAFRIALLDRDEDVKDGTLVWVAAVASCAVSIKLSNAFCLIVPALFYIVRFRKKIKPLPVVFGVLCALFMTGIYMYIGFDITGNPLFPYANGIFKSEYFSLTDSPNDYSAFYARFGPVGFWEYLIWPLTTILHPLKASDVGVTSGRLLTIVVIFLVWFVLFLCKKETDKRYLKLMGVWLTFYLLNLTVFQGYSRYIILMDIIGCVLACVTLYDWFFKKGVMRVVSLVLVTVLGVQTGFLGYTYIIQNYEPAWRYTALANWNQTAENAKYIFRDRKAGVPDEITNDIEVWGVVEYNGSQLMMIKEDVPIIGLTMSVTNDHTGEMLNALREQYKDKNMYTAFMVHMFEPGLNSLSKLNYEVESVRLIHPTFVDATSCMVLMKIRPVDQQKKIETHTLTEQSGTIAIPTDSTQVEVHVGHDPIAYSWGSDGTPLEFYLKTESGEEIILFHDLIEVGDEYTTVTIPTEYIKSQGMQLHWRKIYDAGTDANGDWVRVILQYE